MFFFFFGSATLFLRDQTMREAAARGWCGLWFAAGVSSGYGSPSESASERGTPNELEPPKIPIEESLQGIPPKMSPPPTVLSPPRTVSSHNQGSRRSFMRESTERAAPSTSGEARLSPWLDREYNSKRRANSAVLPQPPAEKERVSSCAGGGKCDEPGLWHGGRREPGP